MAYTVPNLTNGVGYQFQVRALNVLGAGVIAASFTVAATPVGEPPSPPPSLRAQAGLIPLTYSL